MNESYKLQAKAEAFDIIVPFIALTKNDEGDDIVEYRHYWNLVSEEQKKTLIEAGIIVFDKEE